MLEQLKYQNHINEVFEFGKDGIFVDMNDLHDYEWTVTKKGNRIAALDRSIVNRKLPVIIICQTEAKGLAARNNLMEVVEKDVLAMQHGKIIIGDYYFKCFVTKSQKKNYLTTKRWMELTLTLTTDFPFWLKETTTSFSIGRDSTGVGLDLNHDFPYDFTTDVSIREVNNTSFAPSNFRMVVYGPCSKPSLMVGGHAYQVDCKVPYKGYLTIDSVVKKIYLTAADGTQTNVFHLRNRDSYIFEKIQPGKNPVAWDGGFSFDITLLEERSEPKWT